MPLVRNNSLASQCVSDLDVTFHGKDDKLGGNVKSLTDEQIAQSMGVQTLLHRGVLEVVTQEMMKEEVERRAALAKENEGRFNAVPEVEDLSGDEMVKNADGTWSDPNATNSEQFTGGVTLPSAVSGTDPRNVVVDESQKVDDLIT